MSPVLSMSRNSFLCNRRKYPYSLVIILVLTAFSFFLISFSLSNVIEQGIKVGNRSHDTDIL